MASKTNSSNYCCELCGMDNLDDKEMREHMFKYHLNNLCVCPFCEVNLTTESELIAHINSCHLEYLSPEQETMTFIDDDEDNGVRRWSSAKLKGGSKINNINSTGNISSVINCSPQRNHLALNLKSNSCSVSSTIKCPLCDYSNEDSSQLEEHVNRQHFDVTSPQLAAEHSSSDFKCPICVQSFSNASDLEFHVNIEHKDILSPAKPNQMQSIEPRLENILECPVCPQTFNNTEKLRSHIDNHFGGKGSSPLSPNTSSDQLLAQEIEKQDKETQRLQEEHEFELLKAQYGMDDEGNFKEQSIENMKKAVEAGNLSWADFTDRQQGLRRAESSGLDDGTSCTLNLIPAIAASSRNCSNVARVLLCSTVDHYASTYGDKGWGCGYRNTQMILSSLLQHTGYNDRIYQLWQVSGNKKENLPPRSAMPSISHLQKHIEWAWSQGFDLQGAEQLGAHLVNTRKWIGATEVVTVLSSLRIRCQLIDFHRPSNPNGCHPDLFDWVLQYFQSKDDFKPPLYLQHQGHSRTIVGIEQLKDNSIHLLILDPSHSKSQMEQLKSTSSAVTTLRLLRKTLYGMKAKQYQVVIVCGLIDSETEYQRSKVLRSIRVPQK